jgi:segregation and condensation protein A
MEGSNFKVKLQDFEGPLDLLLGLIEQRKLSINQISLARVADDFIAYLQSLNDFPVAESADFLLIASTLVLIKSKSLLPNLQLSDEESGSIEDLERRLKFLQQMKETAKIMQGLYGKQVMYFERERQYTPVFSPHAGITPRALFDAAFGLIASLPKFEKIPKTIVKKVISLDEMIRNLSERISASLRMSFREFSSFGRKEKVHVIVSFLAMLELVKQGAIRVAQNSDFEDITIETEGELATPKYV